MRKILDMALPNGYWKKLFEIDWIIYEQTFLKTANKLQGVEPKIKAFLYCSPVLWRHNAC